MSASSPAGLDGLSERDHAVLRFVARLHFASGDQLARLCFGGSVRSARHGLHRLVRLDVLARLPRRVGGVRAGSAGFVYYLGLAGQRLAMQGGLLPARRVRRPHAPGQLFVRHALLIAELHTRLVEAERAGHVELLRLEAEPACWRRSPAVVLKPDSYVRLGLGDFEDSYFIEVDRGTEGSRTIERQLAAYVTYCQSGSEQATRGVFPKTLWLTSRAERVAVIAASLDRLPISDRELFAVAPFDDGIRGMTSAKNGLSIYTANDIL